MPVTRHRFSRRQKLTLGLTAAFLASGAGALAAITTQPARSSTVALQPAIGRNAAVSTANRLIASPADVTIPVGGSSAPVRLSLPDGQPFSAPGKASLSVAPAAGLKLDYGSAPSQESQAVWATSVTASPTTPAGTYMLDIRVSAGGITYTGTIRATVSAARP